MFSLFSSFSRERIGQGIFSELHFVFQVEAEMDVGGRSPQLILVQVQCLSDKLLRFFRQLARVLEGLEGEESELLFKYERLHQPHLDEESGGVEGEKLRAAEVLLDARHVLAKTPFAEKVLPQALFGRSDVHLAFKSFFSGLARF